MAKITTLAAGVGALTGLLAIGLWLFGMTPLHGYWETLTLALAAVLVLDSIVAFVGPSRIFYSTALVSALLAGSEWVGGGSDASTAILLSVVMGGATLVLSVGAARFEPKVSEQSNPMNLPVFG